jgi:hypothetical protein
VLHGRRVREVHLAEARGLGLDRRIQLHRHRDESDVIVPFHNDRGIDHP